MNEFEDEKELAFKFLKDRDEETFGLIYRKHSPRLYLLAIRLAGETCADDALQEMWIRAIRKLPEFRWESKLSTWLCGILIRCCRELILKKNPAQFETYETLEIPVEAKSNDLESLIRNLPDGCRQILVLHDIEGFTHDEIAEKLGIAAGTSKSQLSHARKILRSRIEQRT